VVEGTGPAIIADNIFSENSVGSIIGYRWKEPVTGDLAVKNTRFSNLKIERNTTG